ncbi:LD-carboxypeptidase [Bradyrhizobium prioriisuperbiae]|uniref:LD-carboxypeptidase n=1 Tax=Bradyrhizobium prioriisuperbiae TaxID=2854389 RepID=UPI0028EAE0FE|nr:LD-carboxypeptidase [Bradyrhizobium prioritasuperba]
MTANSVSLEVAGSGFDLRRAPHLSVGDTIRVVCPGWPALALMSEARRERAEAALRALGLKVSYGKNAFAPVAHAAGSAAERASDINDAFRDPSVAGILCAIGGVHSLDLLPLLDYDCIASNPKIFISHSNNASLNLAILAKARLISFQPVCFTNHFGEFPAPAPETLQNFQIACMSCDPIYLRPVGTRTDAPLPFLFDPSHDMAGRPRNLSGGWRWLRHGCASGPLIGGLLSTLVDVADTDWAPSFARAILYWDLTHYNGNVVAADAYLAAMARRGILAQLSGMIVGYPCRVPRHDSMASLDEIVVKWCAEFDGPILVDADCGHTDPTWVLPLGSDGHLDSRADAFWCAPGTMPTSSRPDRSLAR